MMEYIRMIKNVIKDFIVQVNNEIEKERIADYINDFNYSKINEYYKF